jgi:hypothetical protein
MWRLWSAGLTTRTATSSLGRIPRASRLVRGREASSYCEATKQKALFVPPTSFVDGLAGFTSTVKLENKLVR